MENTKTKIVMYDDPNIVQLKEVKGWVGKDGRFYGNNEHLARHANSTHKKCECGNIMVKGYSYCNDCSTKKAKENFLKLPIGEWDGKSMMCEYNGERFFSDMDEVIEYLEDNDILPEDAEIVLCEKQVFLNEVNFDELNEEYCTEENGASYYHPEIAEKVEELNELIRKAEPKLWFRTNKRVVIQDYLN